MRKALSYFGVAAMLIGLVVDMIQLAMWVTLLTG